MKAQSLVLLACLSVCAILGAGPLAWALNEASHELVIQEAASQSGLDAYLKEQLGMPDGINTLIQARADMRRTEQWLRLGGAREDAGDLWDMVIKRARFYRHFHDPLQPWGQAGLSDLIRMSRFQSSLRWAQQPHQDGEAVDGSFSWPDARTAFYLALTASEPAQREQAFADTFRALGQVMHLLTDASVPEHARNDPHPEGAIFGNYEYWVSSQHERRGTDAAFIAQYLQTPIALDPDLLRIPIPESETVARVPIARLWDSDRYDGSNPNITTESKIGLAEISNANFLGAHTLPGSYPHPASANMAKYTGTYSKNGQKRAYYLKRGLGDPAAGGAPKGVGLRVDPVLAECPFDEVAGTVGLCQDDGVWRATAQLMLPRAVRYSQAVLDYLFRGTLDFAIGFGAADPSRLELRITNTSAEPMDGTFTLYYDDKDGKRAAVPGAASNQQLGPGTPSTTLFTPPAGARAFVLVFHGILGDESGAVAGRVKPWEAPYIFARQEQTELTSAEQLVEGCDVYPGVGCVGSPRWTNRLKDPRQQRAVGTFVTPDQPEAGKYLKRVWVEFEPMAAGRENVHLRLNGTEVGNAQWERESSPIKDPSTWEIGFDFAQLGYTWYYRLDPATGIYLPVVVWSFPRFLVVETVAGTTIKTPLVWWRKLSSEGYWRGESGGCPPDYQECSESVSTHTSATGLVFFGDGDGDGFDWKTGPFNGSYEVSAPLTGVRFTPTQEVAGHAAGTFEQTGDLDCLGTCNPTGSCSLSYAKVFTERSGERLLWNKNEFTVSLSNATVVQKPALTCAAPWPTANVPEPPPLPEVRFRRDYVPGEQALFQQLGITPPQYEITLR